MSGSSDSRSPTADAAAPRSRLRFLLPMVWLALGARIAVALVRRESIKQDFLSLAVVAFFMTSAVLGSRVWLWVHDRSARFDEHANAHGGGHP
jgi:hypothetical protein